ncbi:MAG: hypothetical protein IT538_00100 [Variibacter sp.]|nr:hypothetical protein [Variibacter sp.]
MTIRKPLLAVAALAALGVTTASSADALAKGQGGWKGGFHHHHKQMHVGWRFHRGYRLGVYLPAYQECVKVVTRRGAVKVVCTY